MAVSAGKACAALAGALLASCASVPNLPYESGVGVADIIRNVRCELATAYAENAATYPWLGTWAAGVELTLDVTEAQSGGVTAELLVPLHTTDSFSLGLDARGAASAQSISSISFAAALASLEQHECTLMTTPHGQHALLRGSLGLKTWVSRAADAIDATGITEQTSGVGYIIEFGVSAGGGVKPGFDIVRIGDYHLGGSLGLSASRNDTHTLNIAMVPIKPSLPARVYVTNFDDLPRQAPGAVQKPKGPPVRKTARPAGLPRQTEQDLGNIIRSLKQTQTGND